MSAVLRGGRNPSRSGADGGKTASVNSTPTSRCRGYGPASARRRDAVDPFDRVQISGEVARFVEGEEAHDRMDRLTRKYLGSERFEWTMPGERRVAVIVRPTKVRHIVGVERFRPGGPVPAAS